MTGERPVSNPEEEAAPPVALRRLPASAPWRWLSLGMRDFLRAPAIGLFFGACFVAMGWSLLAVFENAPAMMLALSAGFLLVGPFLCVGLYHVSDRLERGERPRFIDAVLAWRRSLDTLAVFGLVLLVLELLWARASLVVFALAFEGAMPDFAGSVWRLFDPANLRFVATWMAVGGVFACAIFATCAVSIPMILDRGTDAITAGLTSVRLVLAQPVLLLAWAALIALIVLVAMLPGFAGLLVVAPVLGHATWHAYRAAVEPPGVSPDPERRADRANAA